MNRTLFALTSLSLLLFALVLLGCTPASQPAPAPLPTATQVVAVQNPTEAPATVPSTNTTVPTAAQTATSIATAATARTLTMPEQVATMVVLTESARPTSTPMDTPNAATLEAVQNNNATATARAVVGTRTRVAQLSQTPTVKPATPTAPPAVSQATATRPPAADQNPCKLQPGQSGMLFNNKKDFKVLLTIGGGEWGTHDYWFEPHSITPIQFPPGRYTATLTWSGGPSFMFAKDRIPFDEGKCIGFASPD